MNGLYDPKPHMSSVKMKKEIIIGGGDESKNRSKSLKIVGKETEDFFFFWKEQELHLGKWEMEIAGEQSRRGNNVI